MNFIEELQWRGMIHTVMPGTEEQLKKEMTAAYVGIDPTADSLHSAATEVMPGISLRTVYQTLTDLAEMGELQSIEVGSGSLRFDPNVSDHHHAVCDDCGDVHDVYVSKAPVLRGLDDFSVSDAHIVYRGQCGA